MKDAECIYRVSQAGVDAPRNQVESDRPKRRCHLRIVQGFASAVRRLRIGCKEFEARFYIDKHIDI